MTHANATSTRDGPAPAGPMRRRRGWPCAGQLNGSTVIDHDGKRWADRYRDSTARPGWSTVLAARTPARTERTRRVERRIVGLRVTRRWGPARIGYHLGLNPSTVAQGPRRYGCPRLTWTDPATGTRIETSARTLATSTPHPGTWSTSTSRSSAGSPTAAAGEFLGRAKAGRRTSGSRGVGYALPAHTPSTTTPGWPTPRSTPTNARRPPPRSGDAPTPTSPPRNHRQAGAHRQRLLLPLHGSSAKTLGTTIKHKRTRPYRPQTNGKVERFNRTMLEEWAYARPYRQRPNASPPTRPGSTPS